MTVLLLEHHNPPAVIMHVQSLTRAYVILGTSPAHIHDESNEHLDTV